MDRELSKVEWACLRKSVLAALLSDEGWLQEIVEEYIEGFDRADYLDWFKDAGC